MFGLCFGVARLDPFDWLPQKDSDAVAVAAGFAAVMATAELAFGTWWAVGDGQRRSVRQQVRARERSNVVQESGVVNPHEVNQDIDAGGDAVVRQIGGRNTP